MASDPTGWMPGIPQIRTRSWGYSGFPEDGMYPQSVVSHVAQGYYAGLLNIASASEPGKSWHFSVGRDGAITQHVSIWDPAYHAGIVADPQPLAASLVGRFGTNPNTWSVGIEQEGGVVGGGVVGAHTRRAAAGSNGYPRRCRCNRHPADRSRPRAGPRCHPAGH